MSEKTNFFKKLWNALPFTGPRKPRVSVIELNGVIGSMGPGQKGLSLDKMRGVIGDAFKPAKLDAVALAINSPGGSPVQSRLIFSEIRRQAALKEVPVLAFIEDVGASGGYILAVAGDEIYADESSVVGSIGVISGGFGFHDAISRIGIERRVYTAGENKSTLDPFKPENPEDLARLQIILDELHVQFKDLVRSRRSDKLADDEDLFTGRIWTGNQAVPLGLIDGNAHLDEFLHTRFGKDVRIKRFAPGGGSLLKKLLSSGDATARQSAGGPPVLIDPDGLIDAADRRALWARFGL